jgi:hypothetical protein
MLTIVEQPGAIHAIDDAKRRWARARDAWETISWILSHDPHAGNPITKIGIGKIRAFTLDGARSLGMPKVTILYEVSHFELTIHDALFADSKIA